MWQNTEELFKFVFRYKQYRLSSIGGAAIAGMEKMASLQEKAQCFLWYHETNSPITVQRKLSKEYERPPPDYKSIVAWYTKFKETGSVVSRSRTGQPPLSEERFAAVQLAFLRRPAQSTRCASRELGIPRSMVQRNLHKRLHLYAYKVQIVQALKPDDYPRCFSFATTILQ